MSNRRPRLRFESHWRSYCNRRSGGSHQRSDEPEMFPSSRESSKIASSHGSLELGLSQWKVQATSALWAGAAELRGIVLKVGGMLTFGKLYHLLSRKLLGRIFLESANYQIKNEIIKK
ncbi:Lysyl oxidase, partial [Actinidia chinensis var. chinensis]